MAIVSCHEGASKSRVLRIGFVSSGQDTPITKYDKIERNFWKKSVSFGKLLQPAFLPWMMR